MKGALVILGPTASGKSSLALKIASVRSAEIISLDSALIYKGMDIGTAKPTADELALVPHHLIDIIDPRETYSAAQFRSDCTRLVRQIEQANALPIICGGTMMYYKALVDGLSPLPTTDPKIRASIAKEAEQVGWVAMHKKLEHIDPVLYAKLSPNDKQRVSRALEVFAMTSRPMSSFYAQKGSQCPFPRREVVLLPEDDRQKLRVSIRERFMQMLSQGFVDEVRRLRDRGDLSLDLPSMRCVGYRQVFEYLEEKCSEEEMIERAVIATARLAKHQMTWLRGGLSSDRDQEVPRLVLRPDDPDLFDKVLSFVDKVS